MLEYNTEVTVGNAVKVCLNKKLFMWANLIYHM